MTNRDTLVMLRNSVGIKNITQGIRKTDFCNPFGYPLGIRDWGIFLLLSPMGIRYPLLLKVGGGIYLNPPLRRYRFSCELFPMRTHARGGVL